MIKQGWINAQIIIWSITCNQKVVQATVCRTVAPIGQNQGDSISLKSWAQELSKGTWYAHIGVSYTIGKLLSSAIQWTCKLWDRRGTRSCILVHVMANSFHSYIVWSCINHVESLFNHTTGLEGGKTSWPPPDDTHGWGSLQSITGTCPGTWQWNKEPPDRFDRFFVRHKKAHRAQKKKI